LRKNTYPRKFEVLYMSDLLSRTRDPSPARTRLLSVLYFFQQRINPRHLEGEAKDVYIFGYFMNFRLISVIMIH